MAALFCAVSALAHAEVGEYKLGPGDQIKITVYNHPDLATEAQLSETGRITFPLIGEVTLGGLAKNEAESKLAGLLEKGGFIKQPQVSLLVIQYRSKQVAVLGHVHKPGKYVIGNVGKVSDLIAQAGGTTPDGSSRVTVVGRGEGERSITRHIDLTELFVLGDMSKDLEVSNGDVIYVPRAPVFYVYGEVQNPGAYPLERDMTVIQALAVSGGLTIRGTLRGIMLSRRAADGKIVSLPVGAGDKLQENDVLHVKESFF